jgi:hypothetical protein
VRGDDSTGNIDWYGKIKKIIALDLPYQKEVVIFQCDWYDGLLQIRRKVEGIIRINMVLLILIQLNFDTQMILTFWGHKLSRSFT